MWHTMVRVWQHNSAPQDPSSLLSRIADDATSLLPSRHGPRWALRAHAVVRFRAADGHEQTLEGHVRNLGVAGIRLRCAEPIPLGAHGTVCVDAQGSHYQADVDVTDSAPEAAGTFRVGCDFSSHDRMQSGRG
jgi:hypothetical protein